MGFAGKLTVCGSTTVAKRPRRSILAKRRGDGGDSSRESRSSRQQPKALFQPCRIRVLAGHCRRRIQFTSCFVRLTAARWSYGLSTTSFQAAAAQALSMGSSVKLAGRSFCGVKHPVHQPPRGAAAVVYWTLGRTVLGKSERTVQASVGVPGVQLMGAHSSWDIGFQPF